MLCDGFGSLGRSVLGQQTAAHLVPGCLAGSQSGAEAATPSAPRVSQLLLWKAAAQAGPFDHPQPLSPALGCPEIRWVAGEDWIPFLVRCDVHSHEAGHNVLLGAHGMFSSL